MTAALSRSEAIVSAVSLSKVYQRGREQVRALDSASFEIQRGEFVAVVGPSGSGKTTLLNLIGCMDSPTAGGLRIGGRNAEKLSERERTAFRREQIGFVFQHFGLLPTLTVWENVTLPLLFARRKATSREHQLLERIGLYHRRNHRPHELSGGEMQRTSIARALVNQPSIVLADEPTGNLDTESGDNINTLFRELNQQGLTIIVVTHNRRLADATHRRLELQDGRISE